MLVTKAGREGKFLYDITAPPHPPPPRPNFVPHHTHSDTQTLNKPAALLLLLSSQHHTIVHELGHAVGYHHEQTRPDRDDWVRIRQENIQPGMEYNFEKYDWQLISDFGVKYDYWSVMHYGQYVSNIALNKDVNRNETKFVSVRDCYSLKVCFL